MIVYGYALGSVAHGAVEVFVFVLCNNAFMLLFRTAITFVFVAFVSAVLLLLTSCSMPKGTLLPAVRCVLLFMGGIN